ncbi:hypothetical protein AGLY_007358 [Aphis glycines]|uniref:HTH CENPB-type domain-containing protein n=1 Tax=Aphis glycines TaxID=307491 RepID=A0A6G0TPN1_APHGL|nr:hypothetical protein AGLY_007358 [Aphis glycines]
MVCEKAKWFHEHLKIEETFNASQGWLFRFKTLCNAWENLPATTLRLSWAKILDQDYEDEENIEDTVNTDIKACLDLVISIPDFTNVDEDDIFDWLQKDLNEEGFERLSDSDIAVRYGSVSTPSTSQQPDSSSESDSEENFEKVQTSQVMEAVDVLLNFCEQENFDFHDVIGLRKIRKAQKFGINFVKPQFVMTDFEQSIINATKTIVRVEIHTCLFYLCQSLYRRIQAEGLQSQYNNPENRSTKIAAQMTGALAFVSNHLMFY